VEVTERAKELACKQLVELVADYLDDALSAEVKAKVEDHLLPAVTDAPHI
jgi:hypothetical protein